MSTKSPLLEDMRADTRPGLCICCDLPVHGRRRILCGERACEALYQRIWRAGVKALKPPAVERIRCRRCNTKATVKKTGKPRRQCDPCVEATRRMRAA